jgi:hypothetical protein
MKFNQKIYDKYKTLTRSSSDICEFKYPSFSAVGMDLIQPGITLEDSNVYIIEEDIDLPIDITFTTNLDQLNNEVRYNYYILQYDQEEGKFKSNGVYVSNVFDYETDNHVNIVNTRELLGEGEYLFKLGYQYTVCTEIAKKLGKQQLSNTFNNSLPYGNYDKNNDKYFVVLYKADEPLLDIGVGEGGLEEDGNNIESDTLRMTSLVVEHGVSDYFINIEANSDIIVTFNGAILTKDADYTLNDNLLSFFEPLHRDHLVNLIYIGKSNTSGFRSKNIEVVAPVAQGITGEEGKNEVYYNTDTNKFELYTDYRISNDDSFIVMLNGVTLTNKIDYFVSSSNKKRVILSGDLHHQDMLTIVYDSGENQVRGVTKDHIDINWYVTKDMVDDNGMFEVELALDKEFFQIEQTQVVPYILGQVNYTKRLELNYDYGQVLYYRIKNTKRYTTISGDELNTENYSDSIRIEIKTNISNNY